MREGKERKEKKKIIKETRVRYNTYIHNKRITLGLRDVQHIGFGYMYRLLAFVGTTRSGLLSTAQSRK